MALSPSEMHDAILKNLPEKTGKNINEWIEVVRGINELSDKEMLNKLKIDYKLGHFQAQTIIKCFKLKNS